MFKEIHFPEGFFSNNRNSYMMEEELVHCNPGRNYVSILKGTTLEARVETILIPSGEETLMTLIWSLLSTVDLVTYITRFQWDMAKYPIKQSLKN